MKIEHTALWVKDLEKMKNFYCSYFEAVASEKYNNKQKRFSSYFLSFNGETRLEIMYKPGLELSSSDDSYGWAHLAVSVGTREIVDSLTERLKKDGYKVEGEPRTTGDGYYESVLLDPEGNRLEITE